MTSDEREDEGAAAADDDRFDPPEEVWGTDGEVPILEREVEFIDEDLIVK